MRYVLSLSKEEFALLGFDESDRPELEAAALREEEFLAEYGPEDPCFYRAPFRPRQQSPQPPQVVGDQWSSIRGRVVNATGTYHSYSKRPGVSPLICPVSPHTNTSQGGQRVNRAENRVEYEGERVYAQEDGKLRWFAFEQVGFMV